MRVISRVRNEAYTLIPECRRQTSKDPAALGKLALSEAFMNGTYAASQLLLILIVVVFIAAVGWLVGRFLGRFKDR